MAHPLKKRISIPTCAYVLMGIWLASFGLVVPAVAHTYHVEFWDEGFTICEEFWIGQEHERLAYAYDTVLVTYVLPLSALCVSNLGISVKLCSCVAPDNHTKNQAEARKHKLFCLFCAM